MIRGDWIRLTLTGLATLWASWLSALESYQQIPFTLPADVQQVLVADADGDGGRELLAVSENELRIYFQRDGSFECAASRPGYVFSDYPACNAGHTDYVAITANEGVGCYVTSTGWGQSGHLWAK